MRAAFVRSPAGASAPVGAARCGSPRRAAPRSSTKRSKVSRSIPNCDAEPISTAIAGPRGAIATARAGKTTMTASGDPNDALSPNRSHTMTLLAAYAARVSRSAWASPTDSSTTPSPDSSAGANALLPAGQFIAPDFDANVYTNAIPKAVRTIGDAPVKLVDGLRPVLIRDVARIEDGGA